MHQQTDAIRSATLKNPQLKYDQWRHDIRTSMMVSKDMGHHLLD